MSPYWTAHLLNVSSGAGSASGMLPTRKCGFGPGGRSIPSPTSLFLEQSHIPERGFVVRRNNSTEEQRAISVPRERAGVTPSSCCSLRRDTGCRDNQGQRYLHQLHVGKRVERPYR